MHPEAIIHCLSHASEQGGIDGFWILCLHCKLEALMKHKQKQPELRPEGRDRWVVNLTERSHT